MKRSKAVIQRLVPSINYLTQLAAFLSGVSNGLVCYCRIWRNCWPVTSYTVHLVWQRPGSGGHIHGRR